MMLSRYEFSSIPHFVIWLQIHFTSILSECEKTNELIIHTEIEATEISGEKERRKDWEMQTALNDFRHEMCLYARRCMRVSVCC